jgi:lysozyme family protein
MNNLNKGEIKMDSNFEKSLQLILKFEGGYVNDPNDHGGATNKGVTQTVYDEYRKSLNKSSQSVKDITDEEVKDLYYKKYWIVAMCDKLPLDVDTVHFDMAVNAGPKQAAKLLQRSVGVADDGVIGPATLAKVTSTNPKAIIRQYINKRIEFYIGLVMNNLSQIKFLNGWILRANSFL